MLEICGGLQKRWNWKHFLNSGILSQRNARSYPVAKRDQKVSECPSWRQKWKGKEPLKWLQWSDWLLGLEHLLSKQNWERSPLWVQPKTSVYRRLIWENGLSLMTVWAFCLVWLWFLVCFLNQNHKLAQITYSFNRNEKGVCVCVCVRVCISRSVVSNSAIPFTVARQAPLSMAFSRQEYWSGLPCLSPGGLLNPGIEPRSPALQADSFLSEPPRKPEKSVSQCK